MPTGDPNGREAHDHAAAGPARSGLVRFVLFLFAPLLVRRVARGRVMRRIDSAHRTFGIVLGAGVRHDGSPSNMLNDRVQGGIALLRSGRIDTLLLSGDGEGDRGHDEVEVMRRLCTDAGIAPDRLRGDREGLSTAASCLRARDHYGVRDAILITQAFHAPRVAYLAHRAGIDALVLALPDQARYGRREVWPLVAREILAQIKAVALAERWPRPGAGGTPPDEATRGRTHQS